MPAYSFIANDNVTIRDDYKVVNVIPFKFLVLGLFLAVGVFMTALAWNFAIVESIKFFYLEKVGAEIESLRGIAVSWLYTIALTFLMLLVLFVFRKNVPGDTFDNDETMAVMQFV